MKVKAVVLAGERTPRNSLAERFDVPASVLVPVAGRPCISRVIETLRSATTIDGGLISGPTALAVAASAEFKFVLQRQDFEWLAPSSGPAESALMALTKLSSYPVLITTGDHALLTPATVDTFCKKALAQDADLIVGLVPLATIEARFPETRRTLLSFRDRTLCGSNLFFLKHRAAEQAVGFWQTVQQERKRPWRIIKHLGVTTLLRYICGTLTAADAFDRLSQVSGCRVVWISVDDPQAAIDVDSLADLELAESTLSI